MARIEGINIAHISPDLHGFLAHMNKKPVMLTGKENFSRISQPITHKDLKASNVVLSYGTDWIAKIQRTNANIAEKNKILFSAKRGTIVTEANEDASYMLFCEEKNILSALHLPAHNESYRFFHNKILLRAYARLRQMAPQDNISVYISGMSVPETSAGLKRMRIMFNEEILKTVLPELINRGMIVKSIDIGREKYDLQEFNLATKEYRIEPPAPKMPNKDLK